MYNIAILGATGNVGGTFLDLLEEREFPVDNLYALASERSRGRQVSFASRTLDVIDAASFDFSEVELVLSSPGAAVSKLYVPKAAAAGAVVIDNTSQFRMEKDVPLVVPEVNEAALEEVSGRNLVANPNCSTIQLVVVLKPLHDLVPIRRAIISTYQSVSGAGRGAMDELFDQTKKIYYNEKHAPHHFPRRIAFNVIPHIDVFLPDGQTKEEWKMRVETHKILDPAIDVVATCVRCPVFVGHALSVFLEFEAPFSLDKAREALEEAPGVLLLEGQDEDERERYMTPHACVGEDGVYVSRLRQVSGGLALWIVADNLRKGAALNAIQIAESLVANGHL